MLMEHPLKQGIAKRLKKNHLAQTPKKARVISHMKDGNGRRNFWPPKEILFKT